MRQLFGMMLLATSLLIPLPTQANPPSNIPPQVTKWQVSSQSAEFYGDRVTIKDDKLTFSNVGSVALVYIKPLYDEGQKQQTQLFEMTAITGNKLPQSFCGRYVTLALTNIYGMQFLDFTFYKGSAPPQPEDTTGNTPVLCESFAYQKPLSS